MRRPGKTPLARILLTVAGSERRSHLKLEGASPYGWLKDRTAASLVEEVDPNTTPENLARMQRLGAPAVLRHRCNRDRQRGEQVRSEALANATKHAQASRVEISLAARNSSLLLAIRDDGVGGADPTRGSGLVGLTDRVEALGGSIQVRSNAGDGTQITAELPLEFATDADSLSA